MGRLLLQNNLLNTLTGTNIGLRSNHITYTTCFNVNIDIFYPGRKGNSDYIVKYQNVQVRHDDIIKELYDGAINNLVNVNLYYTFLSDLANNWDNVNLNNYQNLIFNKYNIEEMASLICYISIQEELNYPRSKHFDGFKRPFYHYLEAVYLAENNMNVNIAINRANAKVRFSPLNNYIPYNLI